MNAKWISRSFALVAAILVLGACDDLLPPKDPGDWGPAASVDPGGISKVNTAALEGCPAEGPDGLSLFFASDRGGQIDIWVSSRQSRSGGWQEPEKLPAPVNSESNDFCPTPIDGGGLLFVSTRPGGCGTGADIYETHLDPARGWAEPEHLGCEVNSGGNEFSPSYVPAGGGTLFFSSDRAGQHDIYMSIRSPDGAWGQPVPVAELNEPGHGTVRPNVSDDGREIVFDSDRTGSFGGNDIWSATRRSTSDPWSEPVNLGANVNSESMETRATLSRDGERLYFGSNRPGHEGSSDIFVSTR